MTSTSTDSPSRLALQNSSAPKLCDHYTDTLAIGWRQRAKRQDSAAVTFAGLCESDDRLQAGLDALVLLQRHAKNHMQGMLQSPLRRGELFAASLFALASSDQALFDACLDLAVAMPDLQNALADACLWAPANAMLHAAIARLPAGARMHVAAARFADFAGLADETMAWLRTVEPAPQHIVALCRLLRLMGRSDLAPGLVRYFAHDDAQVRAASASAALALNGAKPVQGALQTLGELTGSPDTAACEIAVRYTLLFAPQHTPELLARLAADPAAIRLYLLALGWAGKPEAIPTLIDYCRNDATRRLAGASLALVTGSDPIRDGWRGTPPDAASDNGGDTIPDTDPDSGLPWPDADAASRWWHANAARFDSKQRYLAGRPLSKEWLAQLLATGPLAWRHLAADYLQHATARPLFPTHLPAATQCARLAELA